VLAISECYVYENLTLVYTLSQEEVEKDEMEIKNILIEQAQDSLDPGISRENGCPSM